MNLITKGIIYLEEPLQNTEKKWELNHQVKEKDFKINSNKII